jgi:hypothetical protein
MKELPTMNPKTRAALVVEMRTKTLREIQARTGIAKGTLMAIWAEEGCRQNMRLVRMYLRGEIPDPDQTARLLAPGGRFHVANETKTYG